MFGAWVGIDGLIACRHECGLQCKARFRQHAHGAERDGEEADALTKQLAITVPLMLTGTIMDRALAFGQTERGIDWDEKGASIIDKVQDLLVAEGTRVSAIRSYSTQRPVGRFGDPARSMPTTASGMLLAIRISVEWNRGGFAAQKC